MEAVDGRPTGEICFLVLTLGREASPAGPTSAPMLRWDPQRAWRALGDLWHRLRHRLERWLGDGSIGSRWVAVAEQHQDGAPHLNVAIVSRELAAVLRESPVVELDNGRVLPQGQLLEHVVGSGFGYRSYGEVARSRGAVAGYAVKLAGEGELMGGSRSKWTKRARRARLAGEISKRSQAPVRAPTGFRRLRSGIGFLPERRRGSGAMTAVAVRRTSDGRAWAIAGRNPLSRDGGVVLANRPVPGHWTIDVVRSVVYPPDAPPVHWPRAADLDRLADRLAGRSERAGRTDGASDPRNLAADLLARESVQAGRCPRPVGELDSVAPRDGPGLARSRPVSTGPP